MTNATMQSAGDTDWFKLNLIAGKTYTIKTTGLNYLTLYEILPASLASDRSVTVLSAGLPPNPATITFTADTTGAYEFAAIDISGKIGAYTITAAPVINTYALANHVALAVGGTDRATMQSAGDTDWFKISLTAGKTYTFKTTGLSQLARYNIVPAASAMDFQVAVQSFSLPPANGTVTFTADTTGVYEFSAIDSSGFTGAYTLSDALVTNTYALANHVALAVGGTDKATMQSKGDTDWFKLSLTAGKTYTVKTTNLSQEAFYNLVPLALAKDFPINVQASGLPPANGEVTFTADTTGVYEFSASDPNGFTGAYTVSAAAVTNTYALVNGVTLAVGGTDKATMQSAGDTDWFKLSLTAGKTYTFKTTGLNALAQYQIVPAALAADGPVVVHPLKVPAANGTVTFTADKTGVYEFAAGDLNGFTGAYTLSDALVVNTYTLANGVTLAVGGTDKATMQSAGDTDWFKISLTAGKTYTFKTTGLNAAAAYQVLPAAVAGDLPVAVTTTKLASSNGITTFTADKTGVYELSVSDANGFTGAYTVSATIVTNTYTLANGVILPTGPFVQAMAGLGAGAAAQHGPLPDNAAGGTALALALAAQGRMSGRGWANLA